MTLKHSQIEHLKTHICTQNNIYFRIVHLEYFFQASLYSSLNIVYKGLVDLNKFFFPGIILLFWREEGWRERGRKKRLCNFY